MPYEFITTLLDFKGFQVSDVQIEDRSAFRMVFVTLESLSGTHWCGECGKAGLPGYDSTEVDVRAGWAEAFACSVLEKRGSVMGSASLTNRRCLLTGFKRSESSSW